MNSEAESIDSNKTQLKDSKELFNSPSDRSLDFNKPESGTPVSSSRSESTYLVHFWSNISSLSSIVSNFVKPTISESSKVLNELRSDDDGSELSVPMKTFSGTTKSTTSISDVVAMPKDFLSSNNVTTSTSEANCEVSISQKGVSKITVDSVPDIDQFELTKFEANNSRRRRRARRRLQQGGVFSSFADWLPNFFQSNHSVSSPGFVQQLVLQALLSPSSQPSSDTSDAMGRRLYALMTSSTLTSRDFNGNLVASQFRPKITSITDDEASGDFDLMKPEDQKAALLVELGPIRPDYIPRVALTSRTR